MTDPTLEERAVRDALSYSSGMIGLVEAWVAAAVEAKIERLWEALESFPWEWVMTIHKLDESILKEWLAKRSAALAPATEVKRRASVESMSIVARFDEMGVLALHDGQTLLDLAVVLDAALSPEPSPPMTEIEKTPEKRAMELFEDSIDTNGDATWPGTILIAAEIQAAVDIAVAVERERSRTCPACEVMFDD